MLLQQITLLVMDGADDGLDHVSDLDLNRVVNDLRHEVVLCHGLQLLSFLNYHTRQCDGVLISSSNETAVIHTMLGNSILNIDGLEPWLRDASLVLALSMHERLDFRSLLGPVRHLVFMRNLHATISASCVFNDSLFFQLHPVC